MKTQTEFALAHQVDGQLTDAQAMQMLSLPEGDSTTVQSNDPPDVAATAVKPAAEVEVKSVETPAPEAKPVLLAKDGVHTIPYEKLTEAREAEQVARAAAAELQRQLEALQAAKPAQAAPVVTDQAKAEALAAIDPSVFGDFSEGDIAKGIQAVVASQTAAIKAEFDAKLIAALEPIQKQTVESESDKHFSAINAKHSDVESVVPSQEFANWLDAQPSIVRGAYKAAIDGGTAAEVIEVLDTYKAATVKPAATTGKPDAAAAAQAAIAKAQTAPPKSLSEIPASTNVMTDEVGAMLEMSEAGMLSKFDGKTPEQIAALVSRLL